MTSLPTGFQEIWRVEVGSTVHGCNVDDQDDQDLMGVCIETPDYVCGLKGFEQHQYRDAWVRTMTGKSSADQPRSMPGDVDLVVYSLRKFCRLALGGNPSVHLLFFSPKIKIDTPLGRNLVALAPAFRSKAVIYAYLGYMYEQRQRLEGKRGQKGVIRADLIAKYGYDTKYAYHILRLGHQGLEYCNTGKLSLPMDSVHREYLLAVRTGKVRFDEAMQMASNLEEKLRGRVLEDKTLDLPDEPDRAAVDQFLYETYREAWTNPGLNSFTNLS